MDRKHILEILNSGRKNTLLETLGMEYTDCGEGFLEATMPVGPKVHQPYGYLHGGASVALAETVGSAGSGILIDKENENVFGIEISANHLRSKKEGMLRAEGRMIHRGRRTHHWRIDIFDEENALICTCKMTNMVVRKRKDK